MRIGPRDILCGMGVGAAGAMAGLATDPPLFPDEDENDDEFALAGTVVVGLASGIVYPT